MSSDTYNTIAPFLTFSSNMSNSQAQAVASRYTAIQGARPPIASFFRAGNHAIDSSYYYPYRRDFGTFSNNGATQTLVWWQANHPDWVLYQADQVTPAYSFGHTQFIPLDVSNPDVVAWQVSTYGQPASANGNYNWIWLDNLDPNNQDAAVGVFRASVWTPLYTGASVDSAYVTAITNYCASLRSQLAALSPSLKLIANIGPGSYALNSSSIVGIVNNLDAVFDQGGFTNYGIANITGASWVARVQWMQTVQAQGKGFYLVHQLPVDTQANRQYGVASYLMGKYHNAGIYLVPMLSGSPDFGSEQYYYPEYASATLLGAPLEDMTLDQSIYRRNFVNGLVLVNNDTVAHNYTLPAGKTFYTSYGIATSGTITLAATSAIILTGLVVAPISNTNDTPKAMVLVDSSGNKYV